MNNTLSEMINAVNDSRKLNTMKKTATLALA